MVNEIIVIPGSVRSMGVVMQGADLSGVMKKIGIKTQIVQVGRYKTVEIPSRKWKDYEINELNKVIQGTYDMFTQDIANTRGLDIKKRDLFCQCSYIYCETSKRCRFS